jgi:hypothetical protein
MVRQSTGSTPGSRRFSAFCTRAEVPVAPNLPRGQFCLLDFSPERTLFAAHECVRLNVSVRVVHDHPPRRHRDHGAAVGGRGRGDGVGSARTAPPCPGGPRRCLSRPISQRWASSELAASDAPAQAVIDQVTVQLTALLGLRGCRFESSSVPVLLRLTADGRVSFEDGLWDLDQFGMPAVGVQIEAHSGGVSFGRFVLDPVPGSLAPFAARQAAVVLVQHVGSALAAQAVTRSRLAPQGLGRPGPGPLVQAVRRPGSQSRGRW